MFSQENREETRPSRAMKRQEKQNEDDINNLLAQVSRVEKISIPKKNDNAVQSRPSLGFQRRSLSRGRDGRRQSEVKDSPHSPLFTSVLAIGSRSPGHQNKCLSSGRGEKSLGILQDRPNTSPSTKYKKSLSTGSGRDIRHANISLPFNEDRIVSRNSRSRSNTRETPSSLNKMINPSVDDSLRSLNLCSLYSQLDSLVFESDKKVSSRRKDDNLNESASNMLYRPRARSSIRNNVECAGHTKNTRNPPPRARARTHSFSGKNIFDDTIPPPPPVRQTRCSENDVILPQERNKITRSKIQHVPPTPPLRCKIEELD